MYQAVLLDLYGTLLTPPPEPQPFRKVVEQVDPARARRALRWALTHPVDDMTAFARRFDLAVPEGLEADMAHQLRAIRCFADTLPTLRQLKEQGVALALISNLASPYKRPVFDLGLADYFDAIVFSCDRGIKKPQPAIYQLALKRLGVAPEQAIMVGDSQRCDCDAPAQLGIATRQLIRGGTEDCPDALHSLESLPAICTGFEHA